MCFVDTSLSRNCSVTLDFTTHRWTVDNWRGWPAALNFAPNGTFEVRDNGVIWIWEQKAGETKRNTLILRDAPTSGSDTAHISGTTVIFDPPKREYKGVEFRWRLAEAAPTPKETAKAMVEDFRKRLGRGTFPNLRRDLVADSLMNRIETPESLDQAQSSTCGPAAFMYCFLTKDVAGYTRYVTNLYDYGQASIGTWHIRPSQAFRFDSLPGDANACDWIALGSLRDSENWFLEYHRNELPFLNAKGGAIFNFDVTGNGLSLAEKVEETRGGTSVDEMADWFRNIGYTKVEKWGVDSIAWSCVLSVETKAALMSRYYGDGHRVCLSICSNMLSSKAKERDTAGRPDHFIVLTSPVLISGDTVTFEAFTWGSKYNLRLRRAQFGKHVDGFVSAGR